jgi:hypothetical protein
VWELTRKEIQNGGSRKGNILMVQCYVICYFFSVLKHGKKHGWISNNMVKKGKKLKISLLQAVESPRVVRGRGSHIS